jgi:hypothetical protein
MERPGALEKLSPFLDTERGAAMKRIGCVLATIAVLALAQNTALARSNVAKQTSRSRALFRAYQTTILNTFSLHDILAPTLQFLRLHAPELQLNHQDIIVSEYLASVATYPTQSQLSYLVQARDVRGLRTREINRINAAINTLLTTYQQQVSPTTLLTSIQQREQAYFLNISAEQRLAQEELLRTEILLLRPLYSSINAQLTQIAQDLLTRILQDELLVEQDLGVTNPVQLDFRGVGGDSDNSSGYRVVRVR